MTYGIPYTVRGWGDEIVTTVALDGTVFDDGHTAVVRGTESGPVILVPTSALTPVDTTPPEPEPGAWLIGETLCVRWEGDNSERYWSAPAANVVGGFIWLDWQMVWEKLGGSGITPRRLIPEPAPVELPWKGEDVSGCDFVIGTVGNSGRLLIQESIFDAGDWTRHAFEPDLAEAMAAALLAAARAAREATP